MKITKTKKVETITEEIEVLDGTYYFSLGYRNEEPTYYYKVIIDSGDWDEGFADIHVTKIKDDWQDYFISQKTYFENGLIYDIENYFKKENEFDNWYEDISEEVFIGAKERVKQRLC